MCITMHGSENGKLWQQILVDNWQLHIKLKVCLFVCLDVPYTNSHFWTDLNQTLHTSPPWFGRDSWVCMSPQYFTFSTLSTSSVGSECRILGRRWLPAKESSATALYPWLRHVLVWRHGHDVVADDTCAFLLEVSCTVGNALKTWRSERNACV